MQVGQGFHGIYAKKIPLFKGYKENILFNPIYIDIFLVPLLPFAKMLFPGKMRPPVKEQIEIVEQQIRNRVNLIFQKCQKMAVRQILIGVPPGLEVQNYYGYDFESNTNGLFVAAFKQLIEFDYRGDFQGIYFLLGHLDLGQFELYRKQCHDMLPFSNSHQLIIFNFVRFTNFSLSQLNIPVITLEESTPDLTLDIFLEAGRLMAQCLLTVLSLDETRRRNYRTFEDGLISMIQFFSGSFDFMVPRRRNETRSQGQKKAHAQENNVQNKDNIQNRNIDSRNRKIVKRNNFTQEPFYGNSSFNLGRTALEKDEDLEEDEDEDEDLEDEDEDLEEDEDEDEEDLFDINQNAGFWQQMSPDNRFSLVKRLARYLEILEWDFLTNFPESAPYLPFRQVNSSKSNLNTSND